MSIDDDSKILSNVSIFGITKIGKNCVISSNSTIGSEGFSFTFDVDHFVHFNHLGEILIGNHVWIGSNCTIERSQIDKTLIEDHVKIDDLDIDAFLHCNDLTYSNNGEEELKKYKKGDKLKVKVLEIKTDQQKVRVGLKQSQPDTFDWFKDKKINSAITVKVSSSDNKGLIVKPEGCNMEFVIKKSQIAINAADARPTRFVGGERIDAAIAELDLEKRKVSI